MEDSWTGPQIDSGGRSDLESNIIIENKALFPFRFVGQAIAIFWFEELSKENLDFYSALQNKNMAIFRPMYQNCEN